ncbi:MAG: hypothetical protein V7L11_17595 [Nostoc sp.]
MRSKVKDGVKGEGVLGTGDWVLGTGDWVLGIGYWVLSIELGKLFPSP